MTKARLLACPGCARHVRVSEPACVFCGLVLPESFGERPAVPPPPRMSRGGLFAYRARAIAASTAALVTASCGAALEAGPFDAGAQDSESDGDYGGDAAYGLPDSGDELLGAAYGLAADAYPGEDAQPSDASDDITIQPLYGAPAPDAGEPLDARPIDASKSDVVGKDSGASDARDEDVSIGAAYGIAPVYGASP